MSSNKASDFNAMLDRLTAIWDAADVIRGGDPAKQIPYEKWIPTLPEWWLTLPPPEWINNGYAYRAVLAGLRTALVGGPRTVDRLRAFHALVWGSAANIPALRAALSELTDTNYTAYPLVEGQEYPLPSSIRYADDYSDQLYIGRVLTGISATSISLPVANVLENDAWAAQIAAVLTLYEGLLSSYPWTLLFFTRDARLFSRYYGTQAPASFTLTAFHYQNSTTYFSGTPDEQKYEWEIEITAPATLLKNTDPASPDTVQFAAAGWFATDIPCRFRETEYATFDPPDTYYDPPLYRWKEWTTNYWGFFEEDTLLAAQITPFAYLDLVQRIRAFLFAMDAPYGWSGGGSLGQLDLGQGLAETPVGTFSRSWDNLDDPDRMVDFTETVTWTITS